MLFPCHVSQRRQHHLTYAEAEFGPRKLLESQVISKNPVIFISGSLNLPSNLTDAPKATYGPY